VVYSVSVFDVVSVVVGSAFFLTGVFSACVAAVCLSVMGFGECFSAVTTFCLWVFDFDFHSSPIWFMMFVAVLSAIPSICIKSSLVSLNRSAIVRRLWVWTIACAFFQFMP
jgi:hypothetical protein